MSNGNYDRGLHRAHWFETATDEEVGKAWYMLRDEWANRENARKAREKILAEKDSVIRAFADNFVEIHSGLAPVDRIRIYPSRIDALTDREFVVCFILDRPKEE